MAEDENEITAQVILGIISKNSRNGEKPDEWLRLLEDPEVIEEFAEDCYVDKKNRKSFFLSIKKARDVLNEFPSDVPVYDSIKHWMWGL